MLKYLGVVVVACLVPLLALEGALQLAALWATQRSGAWRPGAEVRILCVGDSHTFGVGVPEEAAYPAQLQQMLDERSPGRFSVINLGTPGMATWQVRERLPSQLARYTPDIVVLLAGVNDGWNVRPPGSDAGFGARIEALALHSRLYRFVRIAIRDRGLAKTAAATRADGRPQLARPTGCGDADCKTIWRLEHSGVVDVVTHFPGDDRDAARWQQRAFEDIEAMQGLLSEVGVGFVLVQYPLQFHPFEHPNRAMTRAHQELGTPLAESWRALERVPEDERSWVTGLHPGPAVYREMAREVAQLIP